MLEGNLMFRLWIRVLQIIWQGIQNSELITDIKPCKEKLYVKIADGTQSQVAGIGTIQPTKNLILNSVLFVPKFDFNLLSTQKQD